MVAGKGRARLRVQTVVLTWQVEYLRILEKRVYVMGKYLSLIFFREDHLLHCYNPGCISTWETCKLLEPYVVLIGQTFGWFILSCPTENEFKIVPSVLSMQMVCLVLRKHWSRGLELKNGIGSPSMQPWWDFASGPGCLLDWSSRTPCTLLSTPFFPIPELFLADSLTATNVSGIR